MEKYQPESHSSELLIDLHYLPCLDYISGLLQFDAVQIEACEHYQKQSYRNRCYVLTANKVEALTVPVLRGTHHQPIRDLRIDGHQDWQTRHWRSLQAAYGKAPFFEFYGPELEIVYRRQWTFLFDLTHEMLTLCLKLLGVRRSVSLTEWYVKTPSAGQFDARSAVNPANTVETYVFHRPVVYPQNFGAVFVPNLSIIDLLFCQGPTAVDVLRAGLRE